MNKVWILAWLSGVLFGLGLLCSQMVNPQQVLAFLDISRDWNPALMWVMAGAIAVSALAFRLARQRQHSLSGLPMQLPAQQPVNRRLLCGAALFGLGWGLAGFCPGPALVALMYGMLKPWIFVISMLVGMWLYQRMFG